MIIIDNTLSIKVYKDNNLIIDKNNIAYSKNFDKIVFEIEEQLYNLSNNNNVIEFQKEDKDSIFTINKDQAILLLKNENINFNINILEYDCIIKDNKYVIKYLLESDDQLTTIEINI